MPRLRCSTLEDVEDAAGGVVAVRENPHLQRSVSTAGEDTVTGTRLDLHHAGADVTEDGLLGVLVAERVHEPVTRYLPNLQPETRKKTLLGHQVMERRPTGFSLRPTVLFIALYTIGIKTKALNNNGRT